MERTPRERRRFSAPVVAVFAGGAYLIVLGVKKSRVQIPPARLAPWAPRLKFAQVKDGLADASASWPSRIRSRHRLT
jgi:hypothetical protein